MIAEWQPDLIAFSCNYLANVPEIVDLAKATKLALPRCFICVGGHSASFTARAILEHGDGAIDCVLKGEGEPAIVKLLEAVVDDRSSIAKVPGAVIEEGEGPRPGFVEHLDEIRPRAISCATAANISSACSIPAPRSNSREGAHGTARSAAPGLSMAAAIGCSAGNA